MRRPMRWPKSLRVVIGSRKSNYTRLAARTTCTLCGDALTGVRESEIVCVHRLVYLCVCLYLYVCVCVYVCMCVYSRQMYIVCARSRACVHVPLSVCAHVNLHRSKVMTG